MEEVKHVTLWLIADCCLTSTSAPFYLRFHGGALGWRHGYIRDNKPRVYQETRLMLEGRYSIIGR